jgi:plasmid maintenance system antidote protein VapI
MAERFTPDWFSRPGDTIAALLARQRGDARTLAAAMGKDKLFVLRLIGGTERIDAAMAAELSRVLGGSASFWDRRQRHFDAALSRIAGTVDQGEARAWVRKLPLKEMQQAGWLGEVAATTPLKAAMAYFGVANAAEWREQYTEFATRFAYRSSSAFETKVGSLAAWLRQGELEARQVPCSAWQPEAFRRVLADVRGLTRLKEPRAFLAKLRMACASTGVAVVFVRAPSGCRASGATRFIAPDKAMIILSFRHLSDDHFWFSFFHEAGHLLLHGRDATFIDGAAAEETEREKEANAFAAGQLIPAARHEELLELAPRMKEVVRFAVSIGIASGIVVGQLQHQGIIGRNQLNGLKRRYTWEQIRAALN